MRAKHLRLVHILMMALLLSSCKKNQTPPPDTLVMGVPSAPQSIDPRFAVDSFGQNLRSLLFSSLVRLSNSGPNNTLIPTPDLATEWVIKNSTYRFRLRSDIYFSDGSPITPADILFSIAEFQKPSNPFSATFKKIKSARMDKEYLVLETEKFESTFFLDLAFLPIMPKAIIEKHGDSYYQNLVGSGPFKFISADQSAIQLEANTHSHIKPKINKVFFKIIRDDNSRFLRMYKGDLDIVVNDMPASKVFNFEKSKTFNVVKTPGANITYLLLNLRDPLIQKLDVRQAISHAINKNDIIKFKLEGLATPANTFVLPSSVYFDDSLKLPEYSISKAKALFAKLGSTPEIEIKTSNQRAAVENGKMLAHQFEQAGAQVSLKSYEWGTYYADIRKGNFQIATMKAVGVQDPDFYRLMFHSSQVPPFGFNRGYYINYELDQLLDSGNQITDVTQRVAHYKRVQKIVLQDLAMIPLWYDEYVAIMSSRITHFEPSPQTGFSFLITIEKKQDQRTAALPKKTSETPAESQHENTK